MKHAYVENTITLVPAGKLTVVAQAGAAAPAAGIPLPLSQDPQINSGRFPLPDKC